MRHIGLMYNTSDWVRHPFVNWKTRCFAIICCNGLPLCLVTRTFPFPMSISNTNEWFEHHKRRRKKKKIDWISPIILCKLIIAIPFHYYYVDVINSICFTGKTRHIRSGMKIGRSLWTHRDGRESNRSACTMCTSWVFILSVHTIFVDIHTVIT